VSKVKTNLSARKKPVVYSDFEAAKLEILAATQRGPFYGVLTGSSGTGKTSLLREVAAALDRHRFQVHYLAHSKTSTAGIGRFLAEVLHLSQRRSHTETLRAMAQALRALPFRILLFVDEANLLGAETLQEIRLLAESELDSPPLFTVLFSGLPEFKQKLEAPALFPLRRRISLRLELNGLKKDELLPFLALRIGENQAARLPGEAIAAIFERARGVPALVESLATRCLESVSEQEFISMGKVTEVLESWELS